QRHRPLDDRQARPGRLNPKLQRKRIARLAEAQARQRLHPVRFEAAKRIGEPIAGQLVDALGDDAVDASPVLRHRAHLRHVFAHVAAARHHVPLRRQLQKPGNEPGIVLLVAVDGDHPLVAVAAGVFEPVHQRGAVAHVDRMPQHANARLPGKARQDLRRLVGGAVVHHQNVHAGRGGQRLRQHFLDAGRLVVHRHDDQISHTYVPRRQVLKYSSCAGVSRSSRTPMLSSFLRATSASMSSGTEYTWRSSFPLFSKSHRALSAWLAKLMSITWAGCPSAAPRFTSRPSASSRMRRPSSRTNSWTLGRASRRSLAMAASAGMSISTSKCPALASVAPSFMRAKWSPLMTPRLPVAVTKMWPSFAASRIGMTR